MHRFRFGKMIDNYYNIHINKYSLINYYYINLNWVENVIIVKKDTNKILFKLWKYDINIKYKFRYDNN